MRALVETVLPEKVRPKCDRFDGQARRRRRFRSVPNIVGLGSCDERIATVDLSDSKHGGFDKSSRAPGGHHARPVLH